eukprot:COSAG03_NODE_6100_length_1116_cov_91.484759_1_plen_98_part_10
MKFEFKLAGWACSAEAAQLATKHASALRTTALADLDNGQHWRSHRPFLPNRTDEAQARCSYALQMWRFSLASAEYVLQSVSVASLLSLSLSLPPPPPP